MKINKKRLLVSIMGFVILVGLVVTARVIPIESNWNESINCNAQRHFSVIAGEYNQYQEQKDNPYKGDAKYFADTATVGVACPTLHFRVGLYLL